VICESLDDPATTVEKLSELRDAGRLETEIGRRGA
jgi:hypothetical protein